KRQHRPSVGDVVERRRNDVGAKHHPRPAARWRVVDGAMLVGREIADVLRLERPEALLERPPRQAGAERARKHVGVKRQDRSAEGHLVQFSTMRPGTSAKSPSLFVITVAPRLTAWAASSRSKRARLNGRRAYARAAGSSNGTTGMARTND